MVAYNRQFFKKLKSGSLKSAEAYVPDIISHLKPNSVLDFGCGIGTWLSVFKDAGIEKVYGVDGPYINPKQLLIGHDEFFPTDLSYEMPPVFKVDLAYSMEVAEHLDSNRADCVVEYLTNCSDVVLFGASIPFQGGTNHVNEQWQSYWVEKFQKRGYVALTFFRDLQWYNSNIELWYRQNTLLYVKEGNSLLSQYHVHDKNILFDIVHPQFYVLKCGKYKPIEDAIALIRSVYFWLRSRFI